MLFAVEGKNKTERIYFSRFNSIQDEFTIHFAPGNHTDPQNMCDMLLKQMQKMDFDDAMGDRAFCVFDLNADVSKEHSARDIIGKSRKNNFDCIVSNPCFEVWYLCHFEYSTKYLKDSGAAIGNLQKSISRYTKDMDIFAAINTKTSDAIRNAKKLTKFHKNQGRFPGDANANPLTEAYKAIELLQL